jgi:glycosyltransferase involved in cell wall biosynthesis
MKTMTSKIKVPVSVVVPVFNEATRIIDNLDLLSSELEEVFETFEILVVSDGSNDGTAYKVLQFRYPGLRLLANDQNLGKGAAVRRGFQLAQGDYIFFIDGGMELHPSELRVFAGLMELYHADIVIGSKRHPQSKIEYPWFRKLLSGAYQLLIRQLFDIDVTDTQVGLKLFRREVIQSILPDLAINRYGFDLELLSLARLRGFSKILEAPVQMDYFSKNRRTLKWELWHVFKVGVSLLKDTFRLYRRIQTLKQNSTKKSA